MSPRYFLLLGEDLAGRPDVIRLVSDSAGLTLAFANRAMAAFVNPGCGCVPVGQAGCIVGTLFHRNGVARAIGRLTGNEAAAIAASRGQALFKNYWGSYAAAIEDGRGVTVLRDPSGNFPCYHSSQAGIAAFASDAEILVTAGFAQVSVDCEEIGRQLCRAFVPAPATALVGIRELLAGFSLHDPGAIESPEACWSPWDHVQDRGEDGAEAADRLKRTVAQCVQGWASTAQPVLLSVSGGLDSSIIAACLANARIETICLTMYTDDPSGDERPYARALCDHFGLPLIERPYRLEDVDITEPLAANLPRPRDRTQANAHERVHYSVAREIGAGAFMTGNGGDHVFGYSQSAAPVADRFLAHGLSEGLFASLLDVCRQTGCSITDALAQAWRLARQSPPYRVRPNPLFLAPDFLAEAGHADLHHPWLDAPPGALPGKAAHVATVLRVQPNLEPSGGTEFAVLNPLVSQPVVEACLAIPSWEWRAGGRDRALARRAFAGDLPASILHRRVKGSPGRFAASLLDRFRERIRDRLLGGRLAAECILDTAALEEVLAGERPVPDLQRVRILELVNAEAWIDHWNAPARSAFRGPLPASAAPIP
jgi:asparagine synthase (glutamine-hydrolysing)